MRRHWPVVCLFLASLDAQQTRIVGPGHFATLNDAVAAAVDGDTILIRRTPQWWNVPVAPLSITKSLQIIGEDVSMTSGPITITLAAGKDLAFAGCGFGWVVPLSLHVANCQGRVTFHASPPETPKVTIRDSAQVIFSMRKLHAPPEPYAQWLAPMVIERSHVVFDRCWITGARADYQSQFFPSQAVIATGSTVEFVDSVIRGGNGTTRGYPPHWSGQAAMTLTGSSVTFRGAGMLVASGLLGNEPPVWAANCAIQHEPGFQAAMTLTATSVVARHLPSVGVAGLPNGSGATGTLTVHSAPGALAALLIGFPTDRTTLPGIGSLWLDPATACVAVLGLQNGALAWTFAIPAWPTMTGTQLRWQSAALSSSGLELSPPGVTFFR